MQNSLSASYSRLVYQRIFWISLFLSLVVVGLSLLITFLTASFAPSQAQWVVINGCINAGLILVVAIGSLILIRREKFTTNNSHQKTLKKFFTGLKWLSGVLIIGGLAGIFIAKSYFQVTYLAGFFLFLTSNLQSAVILQLAAKHQNF